jgi:hypothetical protein
LSLSVLPPFCDGIGDGPGLSKGWQTAMIAFGFAVLFLAGRYWSGKYAVGLLCAFCRELTCVITRVPVVSLFGLSCSDTPAKEYSGVLSNKPAVLNLIIVLLNILESSIFYAIVLSIT